jgi:hypothetical protein
MHEDTIYFSKLIRVRITDHCKLGTTFLVFLKNDESFPGTSLVIITGSRLTLMLSRLSALIVLVLTPHRRTNCPGIHLDER